MLKLARADYEALRRHGEETYPHECCGVLLGRMDDDGTRVVTSKGEQQAKGKIFFNTDKFRMEMKPHGDMTMIMITRIDKKVAWNVMPDSRMYMEIPFDLKHKPKVEDKYEGEIDRKEVGRETIDGHPTIKYLIT